MLWPDWAGDLWGLRFCPVLEISVVGGGVARHPQCTEPCQCVSGQPWVCHGMMLQGEMQPLLCAAGVVGPALGAAHRGLRDMPR